MFFRKRPFSLRRIFLSSSARIIAASLLVLIAAGILYYIKAPDTGTITAYALDPDRLEDPHPAETVIRAGEPVKMWLVPPFYSVMPGLCFTFTFEDCEIKVSVDHGHLFDIADNTMETRGMHYRTACGNPVYWSPHDMDSGSDKKAAHARMDFTVYRGDKEIATGCIKIDQLADDDPLFVAHPGFSNSMIHGWYYDVELTEFSGSGYFALADE
jgi:hypothetical protein